MEIIAHRGASYDAPENTLAAVKLAWEQKADAVEVDVHLSKDAQIVVIHDYSTRKTAGARGKVGSRTVQELKLLDAGSWKGAAWRGEQIPLLSEVLATTKKRLFVEVKCGEAFIPAFDRLREHWEPRQKGLVLIGFSFDLMSGLKSRFPELEVCWIVEFKRSLRTGRWTPRPQDVLKATLDAGLDGLDFDARGPLTPDWIAQVKQAGLSTYVWTVDNPALALKLKRAGIDGITTNRPAWLRQELARLEQG